MKRVAMISIGFAACLTASLQGQTRSRAAVSPPTATATPAQPGDAIPGLTASQSASFRAGRDHFLAIQSVAEGLGPVFNGRSCVECHGGPAPGGSSNRTVVRFGTVTNGAYDPLVSLGGSLLQDKAIGPQLGSTHPFRPENVPPVATVSTRRRTTPLFGLGYVDATPDATFAAVAAQEAASNDGTAGHLSMVDNIAAGMKTVGKFGWKAQVPTLGQFSSDAFLNEMGITNPQFTAEVCPQGDCTELSFNPAPALNDDGTKTRGAGEFMRFLAVPPRGPITTDVTDGEQIFERIGCTSCHTATLQTGTSDVAAMSRVTYHPYSDFLLHDMGTLGDGVAQGDAGRNEIRTAPLWGLRMQQTLLHDGRANAIEDAVVAHDGQGRASRDRFNGLSAADRSKLVAFLRSL